MSSAANDEGITRVAPSSLQLSPSGTGGGGAVSVGGASSFTGAGVVTPR